MPYKNIEDDRAKCKRYYRDNKEKVREKSKKRYAEKRDEILVKAKEYYKENPHKKKDQKLKNVYGISLMDWQAMFDKQKGCCAICGKNGLELVVDHNHESGEVRGLLCKKCNTALGLVFEDVSVLEAMKDYLK